MTSSLESVKAGLIDSILEYTFGTPKVLANAVYFMADAPMQIAEVFEPDFEIIGEVLSNLDHEVFKDMLRPVLKRELDKLLS